jgi:guanine nucleotide-binding protein subunit alpha, other
MRIIHSGGFPREERIRHRAVIYSNLIIAFQVLLEIMEVRGIQLEHDENKA